VLSLDGTDDHIEFGAAGDLATGTGDFTWEAWIKPDTTGTDQTFLSIGDLFNNEGGFFRVESTGVLGFSYPEASGATGSTVLTDGVFHHVAVVHSGGTLQLFVDGVAEGAPISAPADLQPGDAFIGQNLFGSAEFSGEIADVRVWDVARSETEIADAKDNRLDGDESGLLAYWKLDEGDGSAIEDSATGGTGHPGDVFDGGSVHADAPWVNESPLALGPNAVGRAIAFDGVDDRLVAGRGPDDVLAITADVTVEAWIRPNNVDGTQTIVNFAGEGGQDTDNVLYQVELRAGGLIRTFHEGPGGDFFVNDFDAGIQANAWSHVAAVRDDNEQTWTVYVNGEQVGDPVDYSSFGSATGGELSELTIGQRSSGLGSFDGLISDVRVWDIDRSAEQIADNYQDFINDSDIHLVANWQMNEITGGDIAIVVDNTDNAIHAVLTGDAELGAEFQVNTTTADAQTIASVAALADGGYIVVWDSQGQDGDEDGVFGQRYDANDNPVGTEFQINTVSEGDQEFSTVVGLSAGGFVVAWESDGVSATDVDVFARIFDADGVPLAAEFKLNTTLAGDQDSVKIEALGDGGFVTIWESAGQDGSDNAVILQRFDASGTALGGETLVNTETSGAQGLPDVTALADGGFVVTWESIGQDGDDGGIFFQRFDASGVAVGSETAVNTTTLRSQDEPNVIGLANGGFAVLWDSQVDASFDENVLARVFDADGQPVTGEFQVNATVANDQRLVEAVALPDGGFIAAWESDGQDGDGLGLFAQRFSSTGGVIGGEFRINLQNTGDQEEISLTALANGDVIAAYQSFDHDGDDMGIFARHISFDGPGLVITSPDSFTDTIEVEEDGSVSVHVLVQDINGDELTASIPDDGEPANGTAVFDLETGFLTYTPDPDFSGTDTITIEVSDGETTSSKTFTVNVIGENDAPIIGQSELATALGAIVSTFDDDADDWTVINDSAGVEFFEDGGNPDGHIQATDLATGGIYSFAAPAKFLGDKSAFSGGTFQFDTRTDSVSPVANGTLFLQGAALTLALATPSPTGGVFQTVFASLDTSADWRIGSAFGAVATQAQIDAVLSDLTAILVPGEYGGDIDTGSLDNVQMTPPFAEGQNIVLTLTADDPDGDDLTFTIDTLPNDGRLFQTADGVTPGAEITAGGTVVSNTDGKVIFVSDSLVSDASISFDFTVTDPDNLSDTATLTFDVVNVTDPISPGGAIQFDGIDDKLVVSGSSDVSFGSTEDFSLEAWIYSTSDGSSRVILDNRDNTTGGYVLMLDPANNLEFRVVGTNLTSSVSVLSDTAVSVNEWTHVAVTADRDGNATLYINGVDVGSESIAGDDGTNISGDLFIGHDSENVSSIENPFEGMIDEVRIWGDVRTASEISQNAGQQVATDEAGLNAYYRFDDQATVDLEIIDLTGNGNGAFLGGIDGFGDLEPAFINHLGKALAPAAGGENSVADDPDLQPESGSLSVSSWFFYDGETVLSDQYLINKGNETETDEGYSILLRNDNKLVVQASTDAGTTAGAAAQTFDLAGLTTGWHQVTMVIDQDEPVGEVRGYLDGFRDGWTDDATLGGSFTSGSISDAPRFVVGRNGNSAGEEFDSLIADVRVFKAALTDLEVDFYQLQALAGDEPNLVGYWTFAGPSESGTFTDLTGNGHDLDIPGGVFNLVDVLAPIIGDEVHIKENTTISGSMSGGEAQDGAVFSISQGLASGTVTIDQDTGEWFVTADPNATGSETFQVQVATGGKTSFQDIRVIYEDLTFDPNVSGAALQFEGGSTTDAVIASAIQGIPTTNQQISFEVWLNPAVVNTPNTPVSYAVPSSDNELTLSFVNGNLEVGIGGILQVTSVPIFENEWQHVAVTYDSVTETVSVYKDGVLGDSFEMTGAGAIEADGTLVLGQDQDSVGGGFVATDAYSGQLDEFRFWNTLRTAEEVSDNYNGQVSPDDPGLIAYYRADGSDGTTLVDLTGTNDAILTDVDVLTHLGRAVLFDGDDDNIVIADDGSYSSQTFTIEAWFKSDADSSGVAQRIVSKALGASSNTWTLSVANGELTAASQINGVPFTLTGTSGGDVRDGLWHHAAYSFDGTTLRLYLDGEEIESVVPGSSVLDIDGSPIMIGDYDNTDNFQQNFQGEISDVRVWDIERSATEIDADKGSRLNGDETGLVGYWPLEGGSEGDGGVAVDFTVNGNDGILQNGAEFVESAAEVFGTEVSTLEGVTVSGHFATAEALGEHTYSITGGTSDGNGVTSLVIAGEGTAYVSESSGAWWFDPDAGFNGISSFELTVVGSIRGFDSATMTIDVVEQSAAADPLVSGGAVQMAGDNTTDFLQTTGATDGLGAGDALTLEMWVQPTTLDSALRSMFAYTDLVVANAFNLSANTSGVTLSMGDSGVVDSQSAGFTLSEDEWAHIAVTWQSSDGETKFYKNGELITTATFKAGETVNNGGIVTLGQDPDNAVGSGFEQTQSFAGLQDEIRFWNRVRTEEEISENFNRQVDGSDSDLIAYYNFDEGSGLSVTDNSTNGNDLTINGGVDRINFLDGAADMPGVAAADIITVSSSEDLDSTDATWSVWVKTDSVSGLTGLIARADAVNAAGGAILNLQSSGRAGINVNGGGITSTTVVDDGLWHNITATFSTMDSTLKIYIDGVLENSNTVGNFSFNGQDMTFGGGGLIGGLAPLNGQMSDIQIWNKALSDQEIREAIDGPLTGAEDGLAGYWRLSDEPGSAVAVDATGNGNDGSLGGNVAFVDAAPEIQGTNITVESRGVFAGEFEADNIVGDVTYDVDGGTVTGDVSELTLPEGTVRIDINSGQWTFDPKLGFFGDFADLFTLTATGSVSGADEATMSVTIRDTGVVQAMQGGLLQFAGGNTSDFVEAENIQGLDTSDQQLTVEMWLRPENVTGLLHPFSYANSSNPNEFTFVIQNGFLRMLVDGTTLDLGVPIEVGELQHFAVTWDSATGLLEAYKDGEFRASGTTAQGSTIENGGTLILGQEQDSVGGGFDASQAYKGLIDEVRVWNTARTESQIADNFNRQINEDAGDLALYYRFDEGEGLSVIDHTGNGNDGTINGGIDRLNFLDGAVNLNGGSDKITITNNAALDSDDGTWSIWVRTDGSIGTLTGLMSRADPVDNTNGLLLGMVAGGAPAINIQTSGSSLAAIAVTPIDDGLWHNVTVTFDSTAGDFNLYVDGVLEASRTGVAGAGFDADDLILGGSTTGIQASLDGQLSDAQVWDRPLTTAEVAQLQTGQLAGTEDGLVAYWRLSDDIGSGTAQEVVGVASDGILDGSAAFVDVAPDIKGILVSMGSDLVYSGQMIANDASGTVQFAVEGGVLSGETSTLALNEGTVIVDVNTGDWTFAPNDGYAGVFEDLFTLIADGTEGGIDRSVISVQIEDNDTLVDVNGGFLAIDGSDNAGASVADDASLNFSTGNAFTVEAYVYLENTAASQTIFQAGAGANRAFALSVVGSDLVFTVEGESSSSTMAGTTDAVTAGQWHHIAATYDGSDMTVYLDGAVYKTEPFDGGVIDHIGDLVIGNTAAGNVPLQGAIDEVRIWDVARDEQQINDGIAAVVPADSDGLVAYYRMDEQSGDLLRDETVNGNDATMFGDARVLANIGRALQFDGVDDFVRITDNDALDPGSGSMTVEVWVNLDDFTFQAGTQVIVGKGKEGATALEGDWAISVNADGAQDFLTITAGEINDQIANVGGAQRFDITGMSGWHHVTMVVDRSSDEIFGLFDGSQSGWIDGDGLGGTRTTNSLSAVGDITSSLDMTIGSIADTGNIIDDSRAFEGQVGEVRIWDRTRTVNEINATMNSSLAATTAGLAAYYRFEESSGQTINDLTGNGNIGTLGDNGVVTSDDPTRENSQVDLHGNTIKVEEDSSFGGFMVASQIQGVPTYGVDGGSITGSISTRAIDGAGVVVVNNLTGEWTFTPDADVNGSFDNLFILTAFGSTGGVQTEAISVEVTPKPELSVGVHGGALQFDGGDGQVTISDDDSLDIGFDDFTIEFWVYRSSNTTVNQTIIDKFDANAGYEIVMQSNGLLAFTFGDGSQAFSNGIGGLPVDEWSHVAIALDRDVTAKGYLNGVEVSSANFTVLDGQDLSNNVDLTIGGEFAQAFDGALDELRIWKTLRSDEEILASFDQQLTGSEPGLSAYYRFDERTGSTVVDATGNGNDGTLSGSVNRLNFLGQALELDGFGNAVTVADNASQTGMTELTLAAWVKLDALGTIQSVIAKSEDGVDEAFELNILADGRITLTVSSDGIGGDLGFARSTADAAGQLEAGEWYHIAGTWDGINPTTMFINGVDVTDAGGTSVAGTVNDSAVDLGIGSSIDGSDVHSRKFDGQIDEVAIFSTGMSSADIQAMMESNLTGNENGLVAAYNFNQDGNPADLSGNGNDGLLGTGSTIIDTAPVIDGTQLFTAQDTSISDILDVNDIGGNAAPFAIGEGPANGTLNLDSSSGDWTYTPDNSFTGSDEFSFQVTDDSGNTVEKQVQVEVA
jgi:hypothetical protein